MRHRERLPDHDDVEIVELSQTLNSLFGKQAKDAALFRNRNGVYMKLANFRAVDPLHTSRRFVRPQAIRLRSPKPSKKKELQKQKRDAYSPECTVCANVTAN
jgi:hypothetical protein